ncbi:hypothetical protein FPCIR_5927 [Fusarium pseudocircinatum]|uniref:Uncharacterized protein n=1 Tax=Fusarium pseudocircinatum TaxID=56676 RepID=A0A8H5UMN5_9HYPO|nr:hypothetical protein FPCIR_5927 [Fusarium pseudocircinatum]
MCSTITINMYCKRCNKYLGNTVDIQKCESARRRGHSHHANRNHERRTETYRLNWTQCEACQYEYSVYCDAIRSGVPYPAPNPPFN